MNQKNFLQLGKLIVDLNDRGKTIGNKNFNCFFIKITRVYFNLEMSLRRSNLWNILNWRGSILLFYFAECY